MPRKSNPAESTKRWRKWYDSHGDPTREKRREKWEKKQGKETVRKKERDYMRKYRKSHPDA